MATNLASLSVAEAARRRSPSSSPVGRIASSDSIEAGGFTPGSVLAERYRIIGLLGRGGMGEVYRADDLKLGQPVALKFLPRMLASEPARLERFYAEVRIARQVSHPNVCRVYDVGEMEGQHYLSMEYVDGEDLASLLRRIGRLPPDKALDIAREICAGLSAAHDKGVLHRDLKPANIMVDGRGRAKITDFGLAVAAGEATEGEISGTPAYMAPEQLSGKGASIRTDIYSLGLVLYELYTGKKAFEGASFQELKRKHSEEAPASPSTVSPGFDPVVERVILRCLEKDPGRRPFSVAQVAAALPGGDPLAAALAAGETPSPEMVAAAGEEGALSAGRAWALFGGVLVVLLAILALAPYATDLGLAPLPKASEALEDRARELARKFGYGSRPADTAFWWTRQYTQLRYRADHLPSPARVRDLGAVEPHPYWFQYRQSPRPMVPSGDGTTVRTDDPPLEISGMVNLALDARGNLVSFRAVPPEMDESKGPWPDPNWVLLFAEAGLDPKRFTAAAPKWLSLAPFDARAEWDGSFAGHPDVPIHVTAASYHGRPVYFAVLGPWDRTTRTPEAPRGVGQIVGLATAVTLVLSLLFGGLILARRNVRLGRGDRRGAFRVAAFLLAVGMLRWLLGAHHVADLVGEFGMFGAGLAFSLFLAAFVWLIYMALEPFARRRWPDLLISWTRLLSGRLRDPLVGRDILIGILAGASLVLVAWIEQSLPAFANVSAMTPQPPRSTTLGTPSQLVSVLLGALGNAMFPLGTMSLLVLLSVLLRRRWLAIAVSGLAWTLIYLALSENLRVDLPAALLVGALLVFVAARFGILALYATFFTVTIILALPLTLDFSRWYAGRSLFVLLIVVGLAFGGFWIALGGKSPFGTVALEE
ncbi:MAG: protein kinase domain-containing protein [Thermoanaerobaculia bacterium]